ncbi:hypothetical protein [Lactococcus lactis]|uniref:RelA/SpoT domain-containing protein n=1 Tax=Lactococcus lactis TaxID=1358 RepID=A0AAW8UGY7_9LACT|nr:hypothetical protein [Lactococcus lactis]MDT2861307.1 hypothetical protein [Lactococcus lactis]MDT2870681.1 hypothetical protein [Lactococcus lactis]MDT2882140.1 hypothetical protein [Lactococcus lactis]MDT2889545.1 hypothetical protein [Lactococcus lactis]MDT2892246.1 hypothetical protein [Lactococcus lactis]
MALELSFCEIERLINEIGEFHTYFSRTYYESAKKYNLKTTQVRDVSSGENGIKFMLDLMLYIRKAGETLIPIPINYDSKRVEFRLRVKQPESAINKIYHYKLTHEDGKIPLQKCLNDLVGFRIIIDSSFSYDDIKEYIEQSPRIKVPLMKIYVRKDYDEEGKLSYIGVHAYFKSGNNSFFPWELQIWKGVDEQSNEFSHTQYKAKREYISWADSYEKESEKS